MLAPKSGETYLDLTAGYGGHADGILTNVGDASRLTLVDRDANAIKSLGRFAKAGARIIHQDFLQAAQDLVKANEHFDIILLDLGVSSPHLDNAQRGFSFQLDGPLDMRMDQRQSLTAKKVVNEYSEEQLLKIVREYGEEPRAKRVVQAIIAGRPFDSTVALAACVETTIGRRGRIHPATRTFQALRIEVNQELAQLEAVLPLTLELLELQGRLAVISFHSLEDRLIKRFFKQEADAGYEARLKILTKKPIQNSTTNVFNPRARSAKLRAAVKINK